jgi:Flp pilus assembly protein TadG
LSLTSLLNDQEGGTVVEVVLLVPVIMFLILIAVQMALWADAEEVVQQATSITSNAAAGYGGSVSTGKTAGEAYLASNAGLLEPSTSIHISISAGYVQSSVSGATISIIPLFHLAVSAHRTEPVQQFRDSE